MREGDKLLYLLTAKTGEMNFATFERSVYAILGYEKTTSDGQIPSSILARSALDMLGHCEVLRAGKLIRMAVNPPALALLPEVGLPHGILTGARSPATYDYLREIGNRMGSGFRIWRQQQRDQDALGPDVIFIESYAISDLRALCDEAGLAFSGQPPAWEIAWMSCSGEECFSKLQWTPLQEGYHGLEFFNTNDFRFNTTRCENELELARLKDKGSGRYFFVLQDYATNRQVYIDSGDWGRFVVLEKAGLSCVLYDRKRFLFAVPVSVPLPRLLARSLCLCSGFLPVRKTLEGERGKRSWLVYQSVPPPVAQLVCDRIEQTPVPWICREHGGNQ